MRHFKKIVVWTVACLSLCAMFVGCGKENVNVPVTTNTVEITEEGRLIAYIVEAFDKDYYDVNELKSMVDEEIAAFNTAKASLVTEAGLTPDNVVKVNVFLTDMDNFDAMNAVYQEQFNAPYPARSTVGVTGLCGDALIEIEMIAKR